MGEGGAEGVFWIFTLRPAPIPPLLVPLLRVDNMAKPQAAIFEADCDGETLDVLGRLIAARAKYLWESSRDSVIATAINIIKSLRAATKTSRGASQKRVNKGTYTITELPYDSMFRGRPARRRIVERSGPGGGHTVHGIHPVNLMFGLSGRGNVYEIRLFNNNVPWTHTKNKGRYVVMAPTLDVAKKFAEARVRGMLRKSSGMMKYSMGIAAARLSTKGGALVAPPVRSKQMEIAYQASRIATGGAGFTGDGALVNASGHEYLERNSFSFAYHNDLRYSLNALRNRKASFNLILMKVANKTASILQHAVNNASSRIWMANASFPPPFPEVRAKQNKPR